MKCKSLPLALHIMHVFSHVRNGSRPACLCSATSPNHRHTGLHYSRTLPSTSMLFLLQPGARRNPNHFALASAPSHLLEWKELDTICRAATAAMMYQASKIATRPPHPHCDVSVG
jgi:hypothetical protein